MREIWRPVVGFESAYEVSNLGRVRSMDRVVIAQRREGPTKLKLRGKILKPGSGHLRNYKKVVLRRDGNSYTCDIHILVLTAFRGPCPKGHVSRHLNDVADENRLSNLKWGTRIENRLDAVRNGGALFGEEIHNAKLTERAVRFIRKNAKTYSANSMAEKFGVSRPTITRVIQGKIWNHVR